MRELLDRRKAIGAVGGAVVVLLVLAVVATQLLGGQAAATPSAAPSEVAATSSATPSATPTPTATPTATPSPTPSPTATPTPPPPNIADLDGVATSPAVAHRLPLAIMIDDNVHARPQSGMTSASIVYQAPADGGEVRYLVVFQEGDAANIGPVRSTRPYFVAWASEYHALLGHFGGDQKALKQTIPRLSGYVYNMDDLNGGACPYHRVSTNVAPYNAFTNSAALRTCADKKGYPALAVPTMERRLFGDDAAAASRPAGGSITVPYPHQTVSYAYDPVSNAYLRSVDGKAQMDPASKQRVTARNVVVLFQKLAYKEEYAHMRPVVTNVGSGNAYVFRDGALIKATWKKPKETDLTRLYDASGAEIPLVRGRIFFQVVPLTANVTYKLS